ncbi:D-isomer-specific 2-hydroxyacid dehydrogenase NAD-binding protein [Dacryopinax primogenitus]|uniref:D-isomer-specific 2-hydroxyacid dehydrogenase NAD-binding protein n=1 Tax=Dacryopinax primogenitus (strain DJM 731) TaxID=1858805 RepID=M5FYT9_DACPD|nr:D-isomer-specific 2-hydroxyacid dehydrogenase NAD-binding protein [Dacryopinax primogenitus]EJT98721.1 D-isomer-specific 2-hydroxyacid dehydrogenase NAD-binding protein [Dacryopinax primogenitus]
MDSPIRVAVLDDYQHVALQSADWSPLKAQAQIDVFDNTIPTNQPEKLIERLKPYNVICAMRERTKFPAEILNNLPNLKLLITTAARNAAFDLAACKANNIMVCGTQSYGNSTVEHTWALLLAAARNIPRDHFHVANGGVPWQTGSLPLGLFGRTLGLIGVGKLGTKVAEIANLFGMKISAWSPNLTPKRVAALPVPVTYVPSLNELLEQSDIISIHMVLSPSTRNLINRESFSHMKPSALLVNTSRGPLVNEAALLEALEQKKIAGAALDVYDEEPLPLEHPVRKLDNVVLSPHMGYVADSNYAVFFRDTVENILAFLDGQPKRVIE